MIRLAGLPEGVFRLANSGRYFAAGSAHLCTVADLFRMHRRSLGLTGLGIIIVDNVFLGLQPRLSHWGLTARPVRNITGFDPFVTSRVIIPPNPKGRRPVM